MTTQSNHSYRVSEGLRHWAKRNMRVCPLCGRKYIQPGHRELRRGQWYKSERKRPDVCWRCERDGRTTPKDPPNDTDQ